MSTEKCRKPSNSSLTSQESKNSINNELENVLKHNAILRQEVYDLATKNTYLMKHSERNNEKFERELIKLQNDIKINENQLLENSRKCLEQQKKFADEVKKLKSENENLKKHIETLPTNVENLENEIGLIKTENQHLQLQNKDQECEIGTYELKLRHAVNIVAALNRIVEDYNQKASESVCKVTQTNWNNEKDIKIKPEVSKVDCAPGGDQRYQKGSENLLPT